MTTDVHMYTNSSVRRIRNGYVVTISMSIAEYEERKRQFGHSAEKKFPYEREFDLYCKDNAEVSEAIWKYLKV